MNIHHVIYDWPYKKMLQAFPLSEEKHSQGSLCDFKLSEHDSYVRM